MSYFFVLCAYLYYITLENSSRFLPIAIYSKIGNLCQKSPILILFMHIFTLLPPRRRELRQHRRSQVGVPTPKGSSGSFKTYESMYLYTKRLEWGFLYRKY